MKTTVSRIALLIVLALILAIGIIMYIEAWDMIKSAEGLMDYTEKALASCMLILLSILLITAALVVISLLLNLKV